jgi:hypothetical protein
MMQMGKAKAGAVMPDTFFKTIGTAVALTLGLLAVNQLPKLLPAHIRGVRTVDRVVKEMHNGDLNAEDLHVLAGSYYEELRNDVPVAGVWEQGDIRPAEFLRYELRPNVKRPYAAGMRITNSLAMANPEYTVQKPAQTRRIALLGASLALGPYGHAYADLLENRLNRDGLSSGVRNFQVLNFAVYGYSVVQIMDAALEKAPKFHPDVYMVEITSLEIMDGAGWRTHVGRLVLERADLKYDYLRKVVAEAGVKSSDRLAIIQSKLAPYRIPVIRWALERIRDHAASEGAQMVIVMVPAPINPDFTAEDFNILHTAADSVGVPVLDLRETFRSANLSELQVVSRANAPDGKADIHPNGRGHEMIFQNLYARLQANPKAWTAVTGANNVTGANKAIPAQ